MKYRVIKRFRDKNTKEVYEVDTILKLSKKRADEILKVGKFIEVYEEPKEEETTNVEE